MVQRRHLLAAGLALAPAAALAGCGLDGGGSGADGESGGPTPFTIYTARDKDLAEDVISKFEAANPEWEGMATLLTLGAQEALERIRAEKSNPQGDIWWGGTRQQMALGASDGLLAAAPQAVVDAVPEDYRDPEGLWVGEMLLAELFMVNTEMMSKDEAPQDWDELITFDLKGQLIIRDVEASGTMRSIYCAMIDRQYDKDDSAEAGYEWLAKLDANTKTYAANPTDLYQRLSRQEAPLSLWNLQDVMLQKFGDFPMLDAVVPASGAPILVDGVAKVAGGPGAAGADLFLEFLMSPETQGTLAEERYQIPTIELTSEPSWLAELNLKEMELDWDRIGENENDWIAHWASDIKGKG